MFLFKPKYLDESLSTDERLLYLYREKNIKRLREVFENKKMPYKLREYVLQEEKDKKYFEAIVKDLNEDIFFRDYALYRLNGPEELCEWVLKNCNYDPHINYEIDASNNRINCLYFHASKELENYNKQDILEDIYNTTPHDGLKIIILQYITNEPFLYEIAKNAKGYSFSKAAITNIHDEKLLKNLAIQNEYCSGYAIPKIHDQDALKEIVLKQKDISSRIKAIERIDDPGDLINPLKEEFLTVICDNPINNYNVKELLARTKDKTARIIFLLSEGEYQSFVQQLRIDCEEILESDLNIVYPFIKKLISIIKEDHSDWPEEVIYGIQKCIKLLYDNNILKKEIEKDIPKTITISGKYRDYYGDGYEKYCDRKYEEEIQLW